MLRWMKDNWKVVRAVIRPHASTFVFLLFVQLISVCLAVLIPLLNMELIDLFVYEKMGRKHFMYVLAYIVFLIVTVILNYASIIKKRTLDLQIEEELKRKVIRDSIKKQQGDYDLNELGELDANIKMDVSVFQQFLLKYLLDYPFIICKLVFVVVILCIQCYEIAIVMGMVQLFITIARRLFQNKLEKQSKELRREYAGLNELTNDIVGKNAYIESLGADKYILRRFTEAYKKYISKAMEQVKTGTWTSVLIDFIMNLNYVAVLGIGSYKIFRGELPVGALLSVIQYMGLFLGAFSTLTNYMVEMYSESKNINNILTVLNREVAEEKLDKESVEHNIKRIEVQNASFTYASGKAILEDANATFEYGKLNCIIGPSGIGKSTLIKLLLRKYSLNDGQIRSYTKKGETDLSKDQISFVPQENIFFTDTIYNNIVMDCDCDREYVYEVCKECSIYEDILGLEDGFETIISNGILNFSGGQIKRLSIARAIVQNKEVLLVDEPTVGLDKDNVKKIVECIRKYAKKKLVVVITHDKTLEENAEKVYSISDKKLILQ